MRHHRRGAALMFFLVLLVMGTLAYVVTGFTPAALEARRARQTHEALAQAREALIGYALTYRDRELDRMYGYLPMPDLGKRGTTTDPNCKATDGKPLEGCPVPSPSGVSKVDGGYLPTLVGRLPWRLLGIPPLRDGHGECLWLIVSSLAHAGNASNTAYPFNWDTLSYLDIHVANGGSELQPLLNNPHDRPWAIIYAPGPILPGQDRSKKPNDDDVTECGGNYDAKNYLDPYIADALGGPKNYLANTHSASDDPNGFAYRSIEPIKVTTEGKVFISGGNFLSNACQGSDCTLLANDRGLALSGDKLYDVIRKNRKNFRDNINSMLERITDCLRDEIAAGGGPTGYKEMAEIGDDNNTCYGKNIVPRGYYPHYKEMTYFARGTLSANGNNCSASLIFANQRNNKWEPTGEPTSNTPACPKTVAANPYQCRAAPADKANFANYLEGINLASFTGAGTIFSGQERFERVSATQSISQDIVRCIPSGPSGTLPSFVTTQSPGLAAAGLPQLAYYSAAARTLTLGQTVSSALPSSVANYLYGCAWRPEMRPMGSGLRGYFTFRINEPLISLTSNPHEGFTFAIVDGDNNGTDACGAAAQHLGYSGNNLESPFIVQPKIAFEIDPRREGTFNPASTNHLTNGRNDPSTSGSAYRGGHVAITYWGGETAIDTTRNPPCTPPAFNSGGTCHLPPEEDDNVHEQPATARNGFPAPPANPSAPIPPLSVPPDSPAGVYKLDPERTQVPVNQDFHVRVELTRTAASYSLPRVRVATTASIDDFDNPGDTIDNVYLFEGDRVLVKNQSDPKKNGIYAWKGADKPMTRAEFADSVTELAGLVVEVQQGSQNTRSIWRQNTTTPGACADPNNCTDFTWTNIRVKLFEDLPPASAVPGSIVQIQQGSQATAWWRSDGSSWQRLAVRVATQGAIDLNNPDASIDGVALASGDRVLVKNQGNPAENGIYVWSAAGAAISRAADADAAAELAGALIQVLAGTDVGRAFRQTSLAATETVGMYPVQWEAIDPSPRYLLEIWILRDSPSYSQRIAAMQDTTRPMSLLMSLLKQDFPPHLRDTPIIPYPFRNVRLGFTTGQRTSINDQTITVSNHFTTWLE